MKLADQMKYHEMQAYWWIASANNGHTLNRELYHGISGNNKFSDQEKINDAMETAQNHIRLYMECAERLQKIDREIDELY